MHFSHVFEEIVRSFENKIFPRDNFLFKGSEDDYNADWL